MLGLTVAGRCQIELIKNALSAFQLHLVAPLYCRAEGAVSSTDALIHGCSMQRLFIM